MLGDDADRLRGVDRGASAEADEAVAARLPIDLRPAVDERDVRVRPHLAEDDRIVEMLERAVGEACGRDAGVGDEERALDAERRQRLAEVRDRARAVHEPGRQLHGADGVHLY